MGIIVPDMGTEVTGDGLGAALFGKGRRTVLGLLLCNSDRSFYLREIARIANVGVGAVQRELARLAKAGIITRRVEGNQVHFQANRSCPVFDELASLLRKTAGVADVVRDALAPLAGRISSAFIYGSVAKGSETADSDVDVMVIGSAEFAEVTEAVAGVQETLSREVNPSVYTPEEFKAKVTKKHHFLTNVLKNQKLYLIGDRDGLERLAGKRLAD
jgi:predicted nucleotidyltransferase